MSAAASKRSRIHPAQESWGRATKVCLLQARTLLTCLDVVAVVCPDCLVGREARALVLSDAFWTHTWSAVLPFAVAAVVVRWFVRRLDQGAEDDRNDS